MRWPRWRTLAFLAVLFGGYKFLVSQVLFASSGQHAISRSRDPNASTQTVDPYAGSDTVVYQPGPDELWLQGFNSASYQRGVTFQWRSLAKSDIQVSDPSNSQTRVKHLQHVQPGVYALELKVDNDRGQTAKDTISIHVEKRDSAITQEIVDQLLQPKLGQRVIVTLPQNDVEVLAVEESVASKYGLKSYLWEKQSGSPYHGECSGQGRRASCFGLEEGVYTYYVHARGAGVETVIPIVIAVYSPKLRIYDHDSHFQVNQGLLPVYIKKEPVVPECEADTMWDPPVPDEQLLLDHLAARALPGSKTIVVGFTGDSYLTLARNWMCSVRRILGNTGYLVVAFDTTARDAMRDLERDSAGDAKAVYYDETLLQGKNMKFRPKTKTASQAWKQIMSVKTTVIEAIVRHGYNVFVMDADTVLLQNPFDYVTERALSCDFQWQADGKDKFLYEQLQSRTHFNAGVYYAVSNERTKQWYAKWLEAYGCKKGRREQHALTLVLHNTYRGRWTLHDPIFAPRDVPDDIIRFCYLDPKRFPDGGYFVFREEYIQAFGEESEGDDRRQYLLHANNLEQDEVAKMNALVNDRAWFLDSSNKACASI